jgi:hypothetical protein
MLTSGRRASAGRTRPFALLAVVAALVGSVVVGAPAAVAAPGFPPGDPAERIVTFEVRTRGTVQSDLEVFRRVALATFNDRRGWSFGGSVRFREVPSGGSFTLWLAQASTLPSFSSTCSVQYSCRVGRNVVINDDRWRLGTSVWPDVREYRHYVLNHELGHWLGLGHVGCGGGLAPVMQQQSISLGGCATNTWPLDGERRAAAANLGVGVRTTIPDVYTIHQRGPTGTEVHVLDGASIYRTFAMHSGTALGRTTPSDWAFEVIDRNFDGVDDIIGVLRNGASGQTEVHVLDGASGYQRWQLRRATPLHATPADLFTFDVADVNGDGAFDVVVFARSGASGRTEIHALDGANQYRSWVAHVITPLHPTAVGVWDLEMGDHDRDGHPDMYGINRRGPSGRTEVHILDGAGGYQQWATHAATPLPRTTSLWRFSVDDYDGDGWDDLYAVTRLGSSGRTEVHIVRDRDYAGWQGQVATALHRTDGSWWVFTVD